MSPQPKLTLLPGAPGHALRHRGLEARAGEEHPLQEPAAHRVADAWAQPGFRVFVGEMKQDRSRLRHAYAVVFKRGQFRHRVHAAKRRRILVTRPDVHIRELVRHAQFLKHP
jgi:hypothetical protein